MFLLVKKYITIRVEKNFIRKILDHDIVFEFKIFSYIKAFFNNIVSSAEIKDASEVKIMFQFTCPLICSRYCTENKSKLRKESLSYCVRPYRCAVKGIKMSHNNKTLYVTVCSHNSIFSLLDVAAAPDAPLLLYKNAYTLCAQSFSENNF